MAGETRRRSATPILLGALARVRRTDAFVGLNDRVAGIAARLLDNGAHGKLRYREATKDFA